MFREFDTFNVESISLNGDIHKIGALRCVLLLMLSGRPAGKELGLGLYVGTEA